MEIGETGTERWPSDQILQHRVSGGSSWGVACTPTLPAHPFTFLAAVATDDHVYQLEL